MNGKLNAVHLLLNAELNSVFISELNPELNAGKYFTERLLNSVCSVPMNYVLSSTLAMAVCKPTFDFCLDNNAIERV